MLAFTWIALRFIHFTSLMLVFGFAMYGAWLAPLTIRRLLTKRFLRLQQHAAVWSLISATAMLAVQGGLMGTDGQMYFRQTFGWLFCKRSLVASGYGKLFSPS